MRPMTWALVALALGAATQTLAQDRRPEATSNAECALPGGWQEVADRGPLYVFLGELHGTR